MLNLTELKRTATGRWCELISRLCLIPAENLDGRNHPCPKCGGKDRFRMIDEEAGALFCNQCFNKHNGDGIAAVMWLTGMNFKDSIERIASELGLTAEPHETSVIAEMAWRKGVTVEALKTYGAKETMRGELRVCRVPMFDADMHRTGDFDLAPLGDFDKGKMTVGSKHGMFLAAPPKEGTDVLLVEGVKDAAAMHGLGYFVVGLPTCRMDGSFARLFRGCKVTIVPDRDKAGTDGSAETASRLFGIAAAVRVAELPAEFREIGGADVRDVLRERNGEAKLREAIQHARQWFPSGRRELVFTDLGHAVEKMVREQGSKPPLLKIGLPDVDYALDGGVMLGEMVIIAGRPSHGKSVVALQALDNLACEVPVLMISEEMSVVALASRAMAGITRLEKRCWGQYAEQISDEAAEHYAKRNSVLVIESCQTAERAIEAIAKAKDEYKIGAVAVDYVQLLRGKGEGRYEQVSDTSTRLKQAAVQHNVVLLAVCQLNRGIEGRKTTCPKMSDLRDSGQLEQDADVILFLEWLHRTSPDAHSEHEYRIMVGKNRNRATHKSVIDCHFKPDRQRLYGVDPSNREPAFDRFGG